MSSQVQDANAKVSENAKAEAVKNEKPYNKDGMDANGKHELIAFTDGKVTEKGRVLMNIQHNHEMYTKAEIQEGYGHSSPFLKNINSGKVDENGKAIKYQRIDMTESQYKAIAEASAGKSYVDPETGREAYIFKAKLMEKSANTTQPDGTHAQKKFKMPDTTTLEPSDCPRLTATRVKKQYANSHAMNELYKANPELYNRNNEADKAAESDKNVVSKNRSVKLGVEAAKAAPEAEAQSTGLEK